jgi:hydroxymethylbilane synthase
MPDGLEVVALLQREDPRDVLVVNKSISASSIGELLPGTRVGTSSLRRRAQLMSLRNDLELVELRGNVVTRIRKVDDGIAQVAILAAAGLHRLDLERRVTAYLDAPRWLPAAGQGAIAIQVRSDDAESRAVFGLLGDADTMVDTAAERAFLGALEGGCQVPIGATVVRSGAERVLHGFVADVDGERSVRGSLVVDVARPLLSGVQLADELRHRGARAILDSLRRGQQLPSPQPE